MWVLPGQYCLSKKPPQRGCVMNGMHGELTQEHLSKRRFVLLPAEYVVLMPSKTAAFIQTNCSLFQVNRSQLNRKTIALIQTNFSLFSYQKGKEKENYNLFSNCSSLPDKNHSHLPNKKPLFRQWCRLLPVNRSCFPRNRAYCSFCINNSGVFIL